MNDIDRAWAAGMLSATGSFSTRRAGNGQLATLLTVKSNRTFEAIQRLGKILGVNANESFVNGKPALMLTLSGSTLKAAMKELEPLLPEDRRVAYRMATAKVHADTTVRHRAAAMDRLEKSGKLQPAA